MQPSDSQLNKQLDKKAIISGFNRAAQSYDHAAVLQREIASRLLERLEWIKINPKIIVDLGAGTGDSSLELAKRYPDAKIVVLDIAEMMLQFAKNKHGEQNNKGFFAQIGKKLNYKKSNQIGYICADAEHLPLANQSVDLIFSNLAIQWCENTQLLFNELQRILSPSGCVLFSTFGVETLKELKHSWLAISQTPHVNDFVDMHELGDAMLQSGMMDPVMDAETIVVEYTLLMDLLKDLKKIGAQNHLQHRAKGLMTKSKFKIMYQTYEQFKLKNGKYPASYEVVYGHAWGRDLKVGVKQMTGQKGVNSLEQPIYFVDNK
jgi:malonyl-CoA O-methyltransferase